MNALPPSPDPEKNDQGPALVGRIRALWSASPGLPPLTVLHGPPPRPAPAPAVAILPATTLARLADPSPLLGSALILTGLPLPDLLPRFDPGRRDPRRPHPPCVLASEGWASAISEAVGQDGRPVTRADWTSPEHPPLPIAALHEPGRPETVLAALRSGVPLLWPSPLASFGESGLLCWSPGARSAAPLALPHLLSLLAREPLLRDRIALAQWDALLAPVDPRALERLLGRLAVAHGGTASTRPGDAAPERIIIEGSIGSSFSLALVNRSLGAALADAGARVELRSSEGELGDFDESNAIAELGAPFTSVYRRPGTPMPPPAGTAILRLMYPPRADDFPPASLRAYSCYAWEETEYPRAWAEEMNRSLSLVTAMSAHVARCLRAAGYRGPLLTVGCGVDHLVEPSAEDLERARALLAALPRRFTFLHVSTGIRRKGVDALLDAWEMLAQDPEWSANLVLKLGPHDESGSAARLAATGLGAHPTAPVLRLDQDLSPGVMAALYRLADAIVQPSRCEGLGLPMAEAILSGKPLIATSWSAQAEFCDDTTCWPVDARLEPARTHLSGWLSAWAEPDRAALAQRLREVMAARPEAIARRCEAGRDILLRDFTWRMVARRTRWGLARTASSEVAAAALRLPSLGLVSTWNARCGIADYAALQSGRFPASRLRVAANITDDLLGPDAAHVTRCWRIGDPGMAREVASVISGCDAVCVQFTFGLMPVETLGDILREASARGQATLAVLHSTADRETASLRGIAEALDGCDMVLVHAVEDLERLRGFGVHSAALVPHGFPSAPPPGRALPEAIAEFLAGHDAVLASFGYLRPHKGVAELIAAFPALRRTMLEAGARNPGLLLLNARYPSADSADEMGRCRALIASSEAGQDILHEARHLPDADILAALSRVDLIALPYRHSLESSSASLRFALASGRPVATSDIGIFSDAAGMVHGLGRGEATPAELATALASLWRRARMPRKDQDFALIAERQERALRDLSWSALSERFHDIVRGLVLDRRLGGPWLAGRRTSRWSPPDA